MKAGVRRQTRSSPAPRRRGAKVRVGSVDVNKSDLDGLRRAWRARELVLFLGAGVSMPYGLPSWNNLVLELLFDQATATRRLGRLWPHYRRAVAAWMTEYFDYNPLVLARIVEREMRQAERRNSARRGGDAANTFLGRLRTHLYANHHRPPGRTTLDAVADLAKKRRQGGIAAVVTFNFDDLLERELADRRIPFHSVTSAERQVGPDLRVIHAHGFVPRKGPIARDGLIFSEPDYHRLTESAFHWALSEVVERLRKNTGLFVGLSMSDPSLRRLLDASRNSQIPPHWQIQKRHQVRDHEVHEVMADVERRAREYAKVLGGRLEQRKGPPAMEDAIHAALKQADSYDREVFESMGVKTIWTEEFEQIQAVLDAIAK
jgi:hypothetical protein